MHRFRALPPFRIALALLAALALTVVTSCGSGPRIRYIPEGGSYTAEEALRHARGIEIGPAASLDAAEAPAARNRTLARLRSIDASASALADILTEAFPPHIRSVPVFAESAVIDGRPAWIVVEAWGGREGELDGRRVWLLDRESGAVIFSAVGD